MARVCVLPVLAHASDELSGDKSAPKELTAPKEQPAWPTAAEPTGGEDCPPLLAALAAEVASEKAHVPRPPLLAVVNAMRSLDE